MEYEQTLAEWQGPRNRTPSEFRVRIVRTTTLSDRPHINHMQGTPTSFQLTVVPARPLPSPNVLRLLKGRP